MQTLYLSKNRKIIIFILVVGIIFYRSPYILLNGRFVAEEGSFWFKNSYLYGPLEGLTQVFWGSGYFNIWPNIASVFATLVPIEHSPLVTVYFALSVQLYLFIYILYSDSNFIISNLDRLFLSLIVLVTPPMVAEVWLNTLTSQVYFTIISILIFFQKNVLKSFFNKISPIILFISGLSSILPCLLSPFFFLKYLHEKNKFNFYNFIFITISTFFQSIIFLYSKQQNLDFVGENTRFFLSLEKLINYTYNVLIKSFLGRDLTQTLYYNFFDKINISLILVIILSISILFFIKISKYLNKDKIFLFLILFFLANSLLALYGSKVEQVQGRFAVIPGILLLFIIYRFYQISSGYFKPFCFLLILLSLITGSYEFKTNNIYPHFLMCINCPDWKNEVKKWKMNKDYQLKIWDYPRKSFTLK